MKKFMFLGALAAGVMLIGAADTAEASHARGSFYSGGFTGARYHGNWGRHGGWGPYGWRHGGWGHHGWRHGGWTPGWGHPPRRSLRRGWGGGGVHIHTPSFGFGYWR